MVLLSNAFLGAPENVTFLRWGHHLEEMLKPACNLVDGRRHPGKGTKEITELLVWDSGKRLRLQIGI